MASLRLAFVALLILAGCEPPAAGVVAGRGPPPPPPPPAGVQFVEETAEFDPVPQPAAVQEHQPPAAEPDSPPLAENPPAEPQPAEPQPAQPQPAQPQPPAAQPTYAPPSRPARQPLAHLSAGVAVPQSLPNGTQIGVSVDYKVTGQLHPSATYVLVVVSSAGEIVVPVKLSPQGGTIQGFLDLSVRPEHKPFEAFLAEALPSSRQRTKVSNTVPLQTSY